MTITRPREDGIVRVPMSWEDFRNLDEPFPSEYYGGCLVVMNAPGRRHQVIIQRLYAAISAVIPRGQGVVPNWGWSPVRLHEYLIPDLMVHPTTEEDLEFSGIPHLVVEVLSTNRRDDLVAKVQRYARWGAPSYWIVDPRDRLVLTFELQDETYVETGRFTSGQVTLSYGSVPVPVDVDALLA